MTRRVTTPLLLQIEAAECGAAALGILLHYYQCYVPLEVLRQTCGVSRDGTNALNIVRAAQHYGLDASGLRRSTISGLQKVGFPSILFWNFNHFVVLEGFGKDCAYLNDPAYGHRTVSLQEFNSAYTGVVITAKPGAVFQRFGTRFNVLSALRERVRGTESALLYLLLTSLFLLLSGLLLPALLRVFVDDVLIQGRYWFTGLLIGMGVALVLRVGLSALQEVILLRLETALALDMTRKFFWRLLHLPSAFFAQRTSGDLAGRIHLHDRIAALLAGDLTTAVLNVLLMVFYAAVMLSYDVGLTLIGIAFVVISFLVLRLLARQRINANQRLLYARAKLSGVMIGGLQALETVKAAGAESAFFSRWSGLNAAVINTEQQLGAATQGMFAVLPLLLALNTTIVLIVGSSRVIEGAITLGALVAFQSLMFSFVQPVNQLSALVSRLQEVQGDLKQLDDVLQYPPEPTETSTNPSINGNGRGRLDIEAVSFHYNPLDAPLIDGFSLTLEPHQQVMIAGASGSGKSTLARLAAGLYRPQTGTILLDGQPIPLMRDKIAFVDQTITLFGGTIRDNLTLWEDDITDEVLIRAAKDACVYDLITLRGGFEAHIEENGQDLSGGQRQCLEIARALVRDPLLLILDEATSALDPITERMIYENLRWRGCTCLIAAHRPVPSADRIITLGEAR